MIRFSCFQTDVHKQPKKIVQLSVEAMAKSSQDGSQRPASTSDSIPTGSTPLISKVHEGKQMNTVNNDGSNLNSTERDWGPEDLKSKFINEYENKVHHTRCLRKSYSVEGGLYQEGKLYADNLTEDYTDPVFSCNDPKSYNESTISGCRMVQDANPADMGKTNQYPDFRVISGGENNGSIFSIGDPTPLDKDSRENSDAPLFDGWAGDDHTSSPGTPKMLKSCSFPNVRDSKLTSGRGTFEHASLKSRSLDDLQVLNVKLNDISINESDDQVNVEQARDYNTSKTEEIHMDSSYDDSYDDAHPLSALARDWVMPVTDDINAIKTLQGESSNQRLDDLPNKDFRIKRIEDWVTGLEHYEPLEETNESSEFVEPSNGDSITTRDSVAAVRVDDNTTPGMEAAKRYITSLNPNATAAQLANFGLAVIPHLSVFATLKVLNLSGNAIVRITAGALPRGLHMLNLSKNNISTIEGLRELTRLRVLDLSYNRILRIGHGLASCSSLKELYLAGNKISEVEGLHRLLKLSVLDLRFNKLSTAKCLGQLAANYNSLQAISLEGNPAQKNVGNEQLKKYLQGLLPHLAYYNRQPMKASTLKDGADRSVRLGINSHQFDRSLRSDHKTARKGSHGVASRKPSTSSPHARRIQSVESPKQSKGRQVPLPPIRGAKVSTQSRHHFDVVGKLLNLKSGLSIRKSRSEGNIGAL
ncbi:Protein phosphatase 1 regulatory subunit pprA [Senna tora]|uniref:Protein phosphatase 1 regulatory subunit pprA n=1 Tax=Senna tora TaxID=362788 RepID=A0A834TJ17_9FABA|nr:Protein phosphatase 1 regulatory subunit pprA [Senna tora]